MTKVNSIDTTRFHTDESLGFMVQVRQKTNLLTVQADKTFVSNFNAAVDAFEACMKQDVKNSYTAARKQADEKVDRLWSGTNMYVESMSFHPNEELQTVANKICDIFDKYGRLTKMGYNKQYSNLLGLLNELNAIPQDLTKLWMKDWVDALNQAYEDFVSITEDKMVEEGQKEVGIVQDSRDRAEEAYHSLMNRINTGASYNGAEPYQEFMDYANAVIDEQKAVLSGRKTRNANKKDETEQE